MQLLFIRGHPRAGHDIPSPRLGMSTQLSTVTLLVGSTTNQTLLVINNIEYNANTLLDFPSILGNEGEKKPN